MRKTNKNTCHYRANTENEDEDAQKYQISPIKIEQEEYAYITSRLLFSHFKPVKGCVQKQLPVINNSFYHQRIFHCSCTCKHRECCSLSLVTRVLLVMSFEHGPTRLE